MKFGVNTFIWSADFNESNLDLLPEIKAGGFDGIEMPVFRPAEFPVPAIRKALEANGLECTVCSVMLGGFSLIGDDAAVRRKTQTFLRELVKTAADVGARI